MTTKREKYRLCGKRDESITRLIAQCKKLAQKEYHQSYYNIARIVHLALCQKFGLVGQVKCYNHEPAIVVENDRVEILWDFNIQTDHILPIEGPVVLYKTVRKCYLFILLCLGQKDLGERTGIRQLQYTKAGSKKDLELVKSCGCSKCNRGPRSENEKIKKLAEEVRCKNQYRGFAKSSIASNYTN